MKKSIFLASSMNFYKQLVEIEADLIASGFDIKIPVSAERMKRENDFEVSHFKGVVTNEVRADFIRQNFDKIKECDAILVINNEKNGIKGYIGANVLMEIAFAFYFRKKIFIWDNYPEEAPYREELTIFRAEIIHKNLSKING